MNWALPVVAATLFPAPRRPRTRPIGPATLISAAAAGTAPRPRADELDGDGRAGRSRRTRAPAGGRRGGAGRAARRARDVHVRAPARRDGGAGARPGHGRPRDRHPRGRAGPTIDRALDPCETKWVDIQRAGQDGSPRPRRAARGQVQQRARRRRRPPRRSHRGPHRPARAPVPARQPDGRLRVEVTLTNAGTVQADQPSFDVSWLAGARSRAGASRVFPHCVTTPLARGRVARVRGPRRGSGRDERHARRALRGGGPHAGGQLDRGGFLPGAAVRSGHGGAAAARAAASRSRCAASPPGPRG